MYDSEGYNEALQCAIAQMRAELGFLPFDDPRRVHLYRNLLWCYHQAFALLYRRIEARHAELRLAAAD